MMHEELCNCHEGGEGWREGGVVGSIFAIIVYIHDIITLGQIAHSYKVHNLRHCFYDFGQNCTLL